MKKNKFFVFLEVPVGATNCREQRNLQSLPDHYHFTGSVFDVAMLQS
jgi:hypothetical protein